MDANPPTGDQPKVIAPPSDSSSSLKTGKLKISFRGKLVKTFDSPPPTSTSPAPTNADGTSSPQHTLVQPPTERTSTPSPQVDIIHPPTNIQSEEVAQYDPVQHQEDMRNRARQLLRQMLSQREQDYTCKPGTHSKHEPISVAYHNYDAPPSLKPDTPEEGLLMLAALRALGKTNAAHVLLPPSSISTPSNELNPTSSRDMDVTTSMEQDKPSDTDSSLYVSNAPEVRASIEELMIAKSAAKFAAGAAPALMRQVEEDDESLALELELEFAQLDPETRSSLLRRIDEAENAQFFESSARMDRMASAAREAAFHNAQLNVDRGRLGPYHFDPHTRTHQVMHTNVVSEPICQPLAPSPFDPTLLIINPNLPLPNGFQYACKQRSIDFHPSLFAKLSQEQRKVKLSLKSRKLQVDQPPSSTTASPSPSSSKSDHLNDSMRYAVMEGYVHWLRRELESHWSASAPLSPYESYLSQFKHQWDIIQPQGCFDYFTPSAQQEVQHDGSTTLWGSSLLGNPASSATSGTVSRPISTAIRQVWSDHRKSLQSEHAVELAMRAAERGARRILLGDVEEANIDIGKQTTRDERRKLQRHEKERPKLMSLFLAQGLVDADDFPLELLTWADWRGIFAALGLSADTLLEEEATKNLPPPITLGPNGQVRARSHKKGAAKAARLAAKKAAMEFEQSMHSESINLDDDSSQGPPSSTPSLDNPPKKRARPLGDNDENDQYENAHFQGTASRQHANQMRDLSSSPHADPNLDRCAGCGAPDNDDEFLKCATCQRAYHTYCIDEAENLSFDGSWTCRDCST